MAEQQEDTNPPPSYEDTAAQHSVGPARPLPGKLRVLPLNIPILNALKGKRVILASASPRRKQLLALIGLTDLEILPSTAPEDFPKSLSPFEYVLRTATQKCLGVYRAALEHPASIPVAQLPPDPTLVISADTIVVSLDGRILEKPTSEANHIAMLKILRDQRIHKVFTAVCCLAPREDARSPGYNLETHVEESKVVFADDLTDEFILAYVKTREGVDKAGGYGMQGIGGLLVDKIEGSWDNVIGLPTRMTLNLMEKAVLRQSEEDEEDEDEVEE